MPPRKAAKEGGKRHTMPTAAACEQCEKIARHEKMVDYENCEAAGATPAVPPWCSDHSTIEVAGTLVEHAPADPS